MVKVLVLEPSGTAVEMDMNFDPKRNELSKFLDGTVTFIGQLIGTDVVIVKATRHPVPNTHRLPPPFESEEAYGPIVLIRMDQSAEPRDYHLEEYRQYRSEPPQRTSSPDQNEFQEDSETPSD
jgi:Family of unknown function (DUF5880)